MPCEVWVSSGNPGFGPYEPLTGQGYTSVGIGAEITLKRGENRQLDLDFRRGTAELTGSIRIAGAEPAEPIRIGFTCERPDGIRQTYSLEADQSGQFHAAGLLSGEVRWRIYHGGWWEGHVFLPESGSIPLEIDLDGQSVYP